MTHARGSWFVGVLALVAAACGDGAIGTGTGGGASGGTGGTAGSGGTGGAGGISGGNGTPVILSFSASPASLAAAGQATLSWQVTGASSLSIDHGVGDVTGASTAVSVTATTIYTLTATNAMGSSQATTAVVVGQNPAQRNTRKVMLLSPTGGESFIAPSSLRLQAWGYDPNVDTNEPTQGHGNNASKVQFFVDDAVVLEVDGASAEYSVFKGYADNIAAGQHRVWARAIYVSPADVLDSVPALISVDAAPAYGRTVELDADVTLSGSMPYELVGTAGSRVRLNGNGHRITGTTSGAVTLKFVDAFNVGSTTDRTQSGFNITTTGTVTIEDSAFDSGNSMRFSIGGSATASMRRNLWRSNMRNPLGQLPDSTASDPGASYPVVVIEGTSTGAKVFAGNNVGAGWVDFNNVRGWTVGGDTDADSNILIGPRVGIHPQGELQVRRNYSHHAYRGGWSQGNNFEIDGATVVVEWNVIYGSSWPVRGVGGEFRYNLVLEAGHQWLWATKTNASVHHNIFVGGDADIGGIYVLYNPTNVRIFNNTIDGLGKNRPGGAAQRRHGVADVEPVHQRSERRHSDRERRHLDRRLQLLLGCADGLLRRSPPRERRHEHGPDAHRAPDRGVQHRRGRHLAAHHHRARRPVDLPRALHAQDGQPRDRQGRSGGRQRQRHRRRRRRHRQRDGQVRRLAVAGAAHGAGVPGAGRFSDALSTTRTQLPAAGGVNAIDAPVGKVPMEDAVPVVGSYHQARA